MNLLATLGTILAAIIVIIIILGFFFSPYIQITFDEFVGESTLQSEAYSAIEAYLAPISWKRANRLKGDVLRGDGKGLVLTMDDHERVLDQYKGVELRWIANKNIPKRNYKLIFQKEYRVFIVDSYLNRVLEMGKAYRQRRLYTNSNSKWSQVVFDHPATFQTLAMDSKKKKEIIDDVFTFFKSKEYYAKIGKPWKRGYLVSGPSGTGKSTLIAAMANLVDYDVYDLDLVSVKDNAELKKLLTEITSKSITVIEDVDSCHCKVTLSGLLNVIDWLWSVGDGERLIVFTTKYVEKLDPDFTRSSRIDKHIELSYCTFQGFKVLAKNYLSIDHHFLFVYIELLLSKTQMTPADVSRILMLNTSTRNTEMCLRSLIRELENVGRLRRLKEGMERDSKGWVTWLQVQELESLKQRTATKRRWLNCFQGLGSLKERTATKSRGWLNCVRGVRSYRKLVSNESNHF